MSQQHTAESDQGPDLYVHFLNAKLQTSMSLPKKAFIICNMVIQDLICDGG